MIARDILVAGQRMADQHRVRPVGIERAVTLPRDRHRRQRLAAVEGQRRLNRHALMLDFV